MKLHECFLRSTQHHFYLLFPTRLISNETYHLLSLVSQHCYVSAKVINMSTSLLCS